jgi:hypothetical protein
MPELFNPLPVAKSQNLISICEIIAFQYATTILTTETPWTNYDGSTVAIDKRISFLNRIGVDPIFMVRWWLIKGTPA